MFFDEPPMEDEQVDQERTGLDADGALQCVALLVGGAHIGNERKSGG